MSQDIAQNTSFFEKALKVIEDGIDAGADAVQEYNANRHSARLLLKLGIAVFAEQRLDGSHDPVERILSALDGFISEHGEVNLDHLRAAHEVLGDEFAEKYDGPED